MTTLHDLAYETIKASAAIELAETRRDLGPELGGSSAAQFLRHRFEGSPYLARLLRDFCGQLIPPPTSRLGMVSPNDYAEAIEALAACVDCLGALERAFPVWAEQRTGAAALVKARDVIAKARGANTSPPVLYKCCDPKCPGRTYKASERPHAGCRP